MSTPENSRNFWTDEEVQAMLEIFIEKKITELFDGKKCRNTEIFKLIHSEMVKKNILTKNIDQIKNKWKALKTLYYKTIKSNKKSGESRSECQYFYLLDEILGSRPASQMSGIDSVLNDSQPGSPSPQLEATKWSTQSTDTVDVVVSDDISQQELADFLASPSTSARTSDAECQPSTSKGITKSLKRKTFGSSEKNSEFYTFQREQMKEFFEFQRKQDEVEGKRRAEDLKNILTTFTSSIETILKSQTPQQLPIFFPQPQVYQPNLPVSRQPQQQHEADVDSDSEPEVHPKSKKSA